MKGTRIALVILTAILLAGCHNEPARPVEPLQENTLAETANTAFDATESTESSVSYLFSESDYIYNSLISYERKYAPGGQNAYNRIMYYEIDGLMDKEIQGKINDRILNEAVALYDREIPPYRGIRTLISSSDTYTASVNCFVEKRGYLFSVLLERNLYNEDKASYIEEAVSITFDLTTGEEVRFADLFHEGYDYQSTISDYIHRCLVDGVIPDEHIEFLSGFRWYYDATLLRPIKTIRPDQKFVVMGGLITLILDYDMPEVETSISYYGTPRFSYKLLPINLWQLDDAGNGFALLEKFGPFHDWHGSALGRQVGSADEENYKYLLRDTDIERKSWHSDNPLIKAYKDYGADFKLSVTRNIGNEKLQQMVNQRAACAEEMLIEFLEGNPKYLLDDYYKWVEFYYQADRYGRFLVEQIKIESRNSSRFLHESYKLYDIVTGQQITVADCFAPGIDYQALLTPSYDISCLDSWEEVGIYLTAEGYFCLYFPTIYNETGISQWGASLILDPETIGIENLATFQHK